MGLRRRDGAEMATVKGISIGGVVCKVMTHWLGLVIGLALMAMPVGCRVSSSPVYPPNLPLTAEIQESCVQGEVHDGELGVSLVGVRIDSDAVSST